MMRPEDVADELVEKAMLAWHRGVEGGDDDCDCLADSDVIDEYRKAMRGVLAAVLPDIQARALREAADYRGPADEAAHFTPEARNLLRSLADRISVLATEDDRCNIPGGCCTHENTHNGLGIAGVGDCTDCMNTGHMHPIEEETT